MMLVIYALILLGPLGKETRNRIADWRINSVVPVEENLIQGALFGGSVTNGNNRHVVQNCFYCIQPGDFARSCPLRGNPTATISTRKVRDQISYYINTNFPRFVLIIVTEINKILNFIFFRHLYFTVPFLYPEPFGY
jgi:hypothetical protein